jgi:hypothetical protein
MNDSITTIIDNDNFDFPMFTNFARDVRSMSSNLDSSSARKLVDSYYVLQENRIAFTAQSRELQSKNSPHELISFIAHNLQIMEKALKYPLENFSKSTLAGQWALDQYGIGPILAAGLSAHIDITKAPSVSNVWRYAGLDPTQTWDKGQKRPYNAQLKTLCWKIGQSFMKYSSKDQCFYGQLYLKDKNRRIAKNKAGDYADAILGIQNLSDAQIDAQSRRYAVKIFLSHYHSIAYQDYYGEIPVLPYPIISKKNFTLIPVPNNPFDIK